MGSYWLLALLFIVLKIALKAIPNNIVLNLVIVYHINENNIFLYSYRFWCEWPFIYVFFSYLAVFSDVFKVQGQCLKLFPRFYETLSLTLSLISRFFLHLWLINIIIIIVILRLPEM